MKLEHKRKKQHYVNNVDFYNAILEYKQKCRESENLEKEKPRLPNYIGECILRIAQKLTNAPNFYSYSYKEEMIDDAIENCIMGFDSFDPEKSQNPFAYFTQICYFAFVRRIKKEKKQTEIKKELIRNSGILSDLLNHAQEDDDTVYYTQIKTFLHENLGTPSDNNDEVEPTVRHKKYTKAHMQKMKEKEELEKFLVAQTQENVVESDDSEFDITFDVADDE